MPGKGRLSRLWDQSAPISTRADNTGSEGVGQVVGVDRAPSLNALQVLRSKVHTCTLDAVEGESSNFVDNLRY